MTEDETADAMKQATERSVALVTAMQGDNDGVLDSQLFEAVQWVGIAPYTPEARRLALQLNQSAHLTTLCIELLAKASGTTVEQTTQRLAALLAGYNEPPEAPR
jgi:hypothetical protein